MTVFVVITSRSEWVGSIKWKGQIHRMEKSPGFISRRGPSRQVGELYDSTRWAVWTAPPSSIMLGALETYSSRSCHIRPQIFICITRLGLVTRPSDNSSGVALILNKLYRIYVSCGWVGHFVENFGSFPTERSGQE